MVNATGHPRAPAAGGQDSHLTLDGDVGKVLGDKFLRLYLKDKQNQKIWVSPIIYLQEFF